MLSGESYLGEEGKSLLIAIHADVYEGLAMHATVIHAHRWEFVMESMDIEFSGKYTRPR